MVLVLFAQLRCVVAMLDTKHALIYDMRMNGTEYPLFEQFSKPDWGYLGVVVPPFSIEADFRFMYLSADTRRALSKVSFMVEAAQGVVDERMVVDGADGREVEPTQVDARHGRCTVCVSWVEGSGW